MTLSPDTIDISADSAHHVYATITSSLPEAVHDAAFKRMSCGPCGVQP